MAVLEAFRWHFSTLHGVAKPKCTVLLRQNIPKCQLNILQNGVKLSKTSESAEKAQAVMDQVGYSSPAAFIFLLAYLSWLFVTELICKLSVFLPLFSLLSQYVQQLP